MDTRSKIQPPEEAVSRLSGTTWTLVVGRFPALTGQQVAELQRIAAGAGLLAVAVASDDWNGPYPLNQGARAQLVAAVAGVDLVVICDHSAAERLEQLGRPAAVIEIDKRVQRDIVADVIARHSEA